ncbi:MAG: amidohydrolase/deacetylase family metallohydrolase [Candidatus Poribacteria bacterium]
MKNYDIIVKDGEVVDPSQGLHEVRDVGIVDGRVAALEKDLSADEAETVVDASGKIVTPGLVDLHVHVYWGVAHLGIEPDPNCIAKGATTVFDAGSSGAQTFPGFKKYVIDVSATRIKAFLHVSMQGQLSNVVGELLDLQWADTKRAIKMCEDNKDEIVGVKIRLGSDLVGEHGMESLKRARAVADATELPLMVHPGGPMTTTEMLGEMKSGDIMTHCYHRGPSGILDEDGKIKPEFRKAVQRGVLMDVGHGAGSFSFEVAKAGLAQDFPPGTISSDLHFYNLHGPVYDLATTASKFLLLGMPFDEVIAKVTTIPARVMGIENEIGTLRVGAYGDVAVFDLQEGDFEFTDVLKVTMIGHKKLVPVKTIKGKNIYTPSSFD